MEVLICNGFFGTALARTSVGKSYTGEGRSSLVNLPRPSERNVASSSILLLRHHIVMSQYHREIT